MRKAKRTEGKLFSRRQIESVTVDGLDFYFQQIDWSGVFSARTIANYRDKAIAALRSNGVCVDDLLLDSPHGSGVRDFVLNSKGLEPDSLPGLASKLLEITLHILAYQDMANSAKSIISLAYEFGRLAMLFDVYEIYGASQAARRFNKPASDTYDPGRNKRIRDYYVATVEGSGKYGAKKATASQFNITARQVARIVQKN